MNKITASAPGKLLLLGDHAAVYARPLLATAVDQRMIASVELLDTPEFQLEAPDVAVSGYKKSLKDLGRGEIPKGARFVEQAVINFLEKYKLNNGIRIETRSDFSSQFGFGSSSASTVCVLKALSELSGKKISERALFSLAYKTVIDIQGVGSGFDIAAAIYGGVLYFIGGGKVIKPLAVQSLPLIVGYSGIKADTATLVNKVNAQVKQYPFIYEQMFDVSTGIVKEAEQALLTGDLAAVGHLMDIDEGLLAGFGVETDKLAAMIYAARNAGAYGAKLSGAGGGDCIIALAPDEKRDAVERAIVKAGGEVIRVTTNAEGVRIEK